MGAITFVDIYIYIYIYTHTRYTYICYYNFKKQLSHCLFCTKTYIIFDWPSTCSLFEDTRILPLWQ